MIKFNLFFNKNKIECTTETPESSPHLHWKWNYGQSYVIYYAYFLFCLVILSIFGLSNGTINAFIVVASYLISYAIYADKFNELSINSTEELKQRVGGDRVALFEGR